MQVTQEKRPGSRIGLTIVLEATQVKAVYDKTLRDLTKHVQVQGFRKGKAPLNLIIRQVGKERVQMMAIDELVNDAVKRAFEKNKIFPVGAFEVETEFEALFSKFNPEADFTFSGSVEVYPQIKLGQYKDLNVTVTRLEPDLSRIEKTINRWRDERATLIPVEDRPAQLNDIAVVDFQGFDLDGNCLAETEAKDLEIELKENQFISGFVSGVLGMSPEETKDIEVQFPDDYLQAALAGKKAIFKVTLQELKTKELPELTNEFVEDLSNHQLTTVEALRSYLTKQLENETREKNESAFLETILKAISDNSEVDLPETLIDKEITQLISQSLKSINKEFATIDVQDFLKELPPDAVKSLKERYRPESIQRITRTLCISEVIKQEQIQVGATELEVAIEDILRRLPPKGRKPSMQELKEIVEEELLTEKVMKWLKQQNTASWVDSEGNPVASPFPDPTQTPIVELSDLESQAGIGEMSLETITPSEPDPESISPESISIEQSA
jgi:trigger factor